MCLLLDRRLRWANSRQIAVRNIPAKSTYLPADLKRKRRENKEGIGEG